MNVAMWQAPSLSLRNTPFLRRSSSRLSKIRSLFTLVRQSRALADARPTVQVFTTKVGGPLHRATVTA